MIQFATNLSINRLIILFWRGRWEHFTEQVSSPHFPATFSPFLPLTKLFYQVRARLCINTVPISPLYTHIYKHKTGKPGRVQILDPSRSLGFGFLFNFKIAGHKHRLNIFLSGVICIPFLCRTSFCP